MNVLGMDAVLKPAEYTVLRTQVELSHGKLPVSELPGSTIVEQLGREIEEKTLTTSRLEEWASEEVVAEAIRIQITTWGFREQRHSPKQCYVTKYGSK